MIQTLVYGVTGQSLYIDAPEGRATGITSVAVFPMRQSDDAQAELATSGTAAVEAVDTIVDGDSGPSFTTDARRVYLDATAGIAPGRSYLLTDQATGTREVVEVTGVVTDSYALLRAPLFNDYALGDTFESTRISIDVDDTWIADDANITDRLDPNPGFRVRWVYTAAGATRVRYSYFDVARVSNAEHGVTADSIERIAPGFVRMLPTDHQADRGARFIDAAYEQLTIDLLQEGIPDQALRNSDALAELVARRALVLLHEARVMAGGGGDTLPLEVARDVYRQRFDSLVKAPATVKIDVATDSSGAGHKRSPLPLTTR